MSTSHPLLKFSIFAVVCVGFAVWIVAVIGNLSLESRTGYQAEFADVQGLLVNDAVKVSGVTVGKVTGIEVLPGGTALVDFEVRDDVPVTTDTLVSVRWRDVFGLRFLYLAPGTGPDAEPGTRFALAQTATPVDLNVLLDRLIPVMHALDPDQQNRLLQALSEALVGNEQEVRDLITDGAALTQAIASRDDELRRLIGNAATVMDAYASREEQLRGLMSSFAEVAETIAARNDDLESAVVAIADAQEELGRMLEANDGELRRALDEADVVTSVLRANHDNLEAVLETSHQGLVSYHLISRLGQWFNVRAVGVSEDYDPIVTERGATLPEQRYDHHEGPQSGLPAFFGDAVGGVG